MHNTIFITTAGRLILNIDVTGDLNPDVIVIDFDKDNSNDLPVIFEYLVQRIADGDIEHFKEILRRANELNTGE